MIIIYYQVWHIGEVIQQLPNGDVNDDYESATDDQGVNNQTSTKQYSHGLSLQLTFLGEKHSIDHGLTYDISKSILFNMNKKPKNLLLGL